METDPGQAGEPSASVKNVADILLVEDNAVDAQLTIRALKRCGLTHRFEHVTDGTEALEYVRSLSLFARRDAVTPRLILLDLGLHKLGGLHVLRQLKSEERTKSIPIVVLTSSNLAIELTQSYQFGVNSYVIKPTDPVKFEEAVAAIGRYWLSINEPPPAHFG